MSLCMYVYMYVYVPVSHYLYVNVYLYAFLSFRACMVRSVYAFGLWFGESANLFIYLSIYPSRLSLSPYMFCLM